MMREYDVTIEVVFVATILTSSEDEARKQIIERYPRHREVFVRRDQQPQLRVIKVVETIP